MYSLKLIFFLLAVIAAIAGFTGLVGVYSGIAQALFLLAALGWLSMLILQKR